MTYNKVKKEILYGAYFFLSEERSEIVIEVSTILDVITQIGGLGIALFNGFKLVAIFFNEKILMAYLITNVLRAECSHNSGGHSHSQSNGNEI